MSKFANCRARGYAGQIVLIACSVVVLLTLSLVIGCGGESGGDGESGGAPKGTLAIKGLYVGMPGDRALEACKKLIDGSKDLMVVDFRDGIGPELDEETKAKQKQVWEETVKNAEADIDRFQQWHGIHGGFYDPSKEECEGREANDRDIRPYVGPEDSSAPIPGGNWVVGSAMVAFAGVNGYQVEWMLPGKRKAESQAEASASKLFSGKVEVPEKQRDSDPYRFWKSEVLEKGLVKELYAQGLQLSKENEKRAFFRLVFEDAQGNPVDKKKLATELVLSAPSFFEDYGSNQEKVAAAEKELEGFGLWIEFLMQQNFGDYSIKGVSLFDPEDPRTEDVKESERKDAEAVAKMAKRGDARGIEKMNMMRKKNGQAPLVVKEGRGALSTATAKTAESFTKSKDIAELSSRVSKLTAEINGLKAELSKKEAPNPSLDHKFNNLKRERDTLFSSLKHTSEQFKRNPSLKSKPVVDRYNRDKARLAELNEKYKAAKEKKTGEAAVIADIKQQMKNKESDLKMAIAARDKATEEAKAAEEAELAKKNRTDLKFLTAARTGSFRRVSSNYAFQFAQAMMKMAANCKVQLEWAVLTEPADKPEEIVEAFSIPAGDYESAVKFVSKLDTNLGKFSENTHGSDGSRKRVYFEKDLEDIRSPLWFRLVLKTTNGVEVAKADAVKKWLEDRGQFPPDGRMKISKKPQIEIVLNDGSRKEKDFRLRCHVLLDNAGNVKKIWFNEAGMERFFNTKGMSGEEIAACLVHNYSELPGLTPNVKRTDFGGEGLLIMQETTWKHENPQGCRVELFERKFYNNAGVDQKAIENDPQVAISLGLAGKRPTKQLSIAATQP